VELVESLESRCQVEVEEPDIGFGIGSWNHGSRVHQNCEDLGCNRRLEQSDLFVVVLDNFGHEDFFYIATKDVSRYVICMEFRVVLFLVAPFLNYPCCSKSGVIRYKDFCLHRTPRMLSY
jgi:hypothetical protein